MTRKRVDKKLRAAVVSRAEEACERCLTWVGSDGHLDHFFGRANAPETLASCWYLCPNCDHAKTVNSPSARFWLDAYIEHCLFRGYVDAARFAQGKIEILVAKRFTAPPKGTT